MPVGSLSFASLLCNMSQDNKCRSLNCFSDAKLIQLMLLQMLNAQVPAILAPWWLLKEWSVEMLGTELSFPGLVSWQDLLAGQEPGSLILILYVA